MKPFAILATLALAVSLPFQGGESVPPSALRTPPATTGASDLTPAAPEPPHTVVEPGEIAPNFSYQGEDGRWLRLSDLTAQGNVLLVFAADDTALRTLQGERDELLDMGVLPVVVVSMRGGAARATSKRLGLSFPLIADSRGIISAQFNVTDEVRQTAQPAWFVLDRRRLVRGLSRGQLPRAEFTRLAASVLAIPAKSDPRPASHSR